MKKAFFIAALLLSLPLIAQAEGPRVTMKKHGYNVIHTDQLKSWYDQGTYMVVLDARSKEYLDGNLLPHAKWVSHDASFEEISAAIPSKDTLVVVYCSNTQCPAGEWLAEKLVTLGYTNVYKYPEGIQAWMEKGYPVDRQS